MKPFVRMLLLLTVLLGASTVQHAQELMIEITKGVERPLPIAVVPFGAQVPLPENIGAVVAADLARSGRFETLPPEAYLDRPTGFNQVDFSNWRALQVDYLVVGQISPSAVDRYSARFQLADVLQNQQLLEQSFDASADNLRRLAHHISDLVYEQITGERGAFATRIAYITASRQGGSGAYTLVVADADGYNPQVVLRSSQPLMSPAWSPSGARLAYVSFENRRSQVVVQDIYSGNRHIASAAPGINGAPAWSPDGQRLALTLSKDGNPEIYLYNLIDRGLRRLTNNTAIDTEPAWLPNGNAIIFTSDRGGSPQLYRLGVDGGRPERITFEGDYNAAACVAPDGRSLALVHRKGGKFHIAVMDMQNRQLRLLTEGSLDESPSFAPNGRMIIYARSQGGRQTLAAVSVDGRVQQSLVFRESDVREPAWSPYDG